MPAKPKPAAVETAIPLDYRPVLQSAARRDGWTTGRQRRFRTVLSEPGCISRGERPGRDVVAFRVSPVACVSAPTLAFVGDG